MSLAEQILERHRRYGRSQLAGQWAEIQSIRRAEYLRLLDAADAPAIDAMLARMFQDHVSFGMVTNGEDAPRPDIIAAAVNHNRSFWRMATWEKDESLLAAPDVGGWPTTIMPDTPRHDHYALQVLNLLPFGGTVLEIGGGYGGFALQMLRRSEHTQVVLCDIPETLYLAWYWLLRANSKCRIAWYDEDRGADVVLLPERELEQWTHPIDVVLAAHSLCEMTAEVAQRYLAWLHPHGVRYFYHESPQFTEAGPGWAPHVLTDLHCVNLVPPGYKELWRAPCFWYGAGGRYWEFLYERVSGNLTP